ncbi:hypothetical protein [Labedella endophytica]|uniref:DUF3558 domain-containing protein n=1 Tax=Labedella endophytica TaxID=1523160 RepID=A0A433JXF3_9MICO|nr:hypothetical protein [Labedella endophytica]RUR03604.1 hypothetical protein ELQ94_03490 [Labedella endophytica]
MTTRDPLAPEPPAPEDPSPVAPDPARRPVWPVVLALVAMLALITGGAVGGAALGGATASATDPGPVPSSSSPAPVEAAPVEAAPAPTDTPTPTNAPPVESCSDVVSPAVAEEVLGDFDLAQEHAPGETSESVFMGFVDPLLHYAMQLSDRLECRWVLEEPGYAAIQVFVTPLSTAASESMTTNEAALGSCSDALDGVLCEFEYAADGPSTVIEQHLFRDGLWIAVVHTVWDATDDVGNDVADRPWDADLLPGIAEHLAVAS